jgi:hypothetical protein
MLDPGLTVNNYVSTLSCYIYYAFLTYYCRYICVLNQEYDAKKMLRLPNLDARHQGHFFLAYSPPPRAFAAAAAALVDGYLRRGMRPL